MHPMTGFITLPRPPVRFVLVAALHVGMYLLMRDALQFEWMPDDPKSTEAWLIPEKPQPQDPTDVPIGGEPVGVDPIPYPPPIPIEESFDLVVPVLTVPTGPPAGDEGTVQAVPMITPVRGNPRHPLTQPQYPPASIRNGEEGVVELAIYVLRDGSIADVRITGSSGHWRLDRAAMEEARKRWRLQPAVRGDQPFDEWGHFRVVFRIENR
jgi:periplasmic protein TonB